MASNDHMQLHLLTLPLELREQVYSHVLQKRLEKHDDHVACTFDLAILRTCRQVKEEALRILNHDHTFVKIDTPWEEAWDWTQKYGRVPCFTGEAAQRWGPTKLAVSVMASRDIREQQLYPFILLADDLPQFCTHWFYQELHFRGEAYPGMNCHFVLTLQIQNPGSEEQLPMKQQRQLLEPFGLIKNLEMIDIKGAHPQVRDDVMKTMNTPAKSATECLEEAMQLKNQGNEAIGQKKYAEALQLYYDAFYAIHIVIKNRERDCYAETYFQSQLERRVDGSQNGNIVYFKVRVRLVANVMQVYCYQERWEDAKHWGMRSIDLMRDLAGSVADIPNENIPGHEAWGKIYFRTGLAHENLGEMSEARKMFRIAAAWLPNYRDAAAAVDRTKLRLM